nr:50S ribosomal protein L32 [Anaerolineae bacterium]
MGPLPKRKTSKGRRDRRRGHHKLSPVTLVECENCGAKKRAHTVCQECGTYNRREIVAPED